VACFRQHIGAGALVAIVGVVCAYHYAYMTDWHLLVVLFAVTLAGSFMPDIDSDTSIPFYLVFGLATIVCTGGALYFLLDRGVTDYRQLFGLPLLVCVGVWVVVGGMIKRFTVHRGMAHSVPAALITSLCVLLGVRMLGGEEDHAYFFGLGMADGYLAHLFLDELHATINIEGFRIRPRRSLGTALKFVGSFQQ